VSSVPAGISLEAKRPTPYSPLIYLMLYRRGKEKRKEK